ncbi:hypothetical protein L1987_57162 [Smallanthus sonchifolius]|uniref:Uncharacterized protein n=1 Tax=Smallanthus sonchifolius TaxID=185202 RepID=A0ACB9DCQ9_9ASTR|nr:hypothetical protein L1987_57162 [Smallanthus sonchifolius]
MPEDGCDFGFAFNDSNFSDRVLRICFFSDPIESTQSPSGSSFLDFILYKFKYWFRTAARVRTLHIRSPILAARSPFFYKLESRFCIHPRGKSGHAVALLTAWSRSGSQHYQRLIAGYPSRWCPTCLLRIRSLKSYRSVDGSVIGAAEDGGGQRRRKRRHPMEEEMGLVVYIMVDSRVTFEI